MKAELVYDAYVLQPWWWAAPQPSDGIGPFLSFNVSGDGVVNGVSGVSENWDIHAQPYWAVRRAAQEAAAAAVVAAE
jgi:hypothetical protein